MLSSLQLANYLKDVGVKKGDAVIIYLPMLSELPITMLACARIGAVHSVIFSNIFSPRMYLFISLQIICNPINFSILSGGICRILCRISFTENHGLQSKSCNYL